VAKEARAYLGGEAARSAQRESALLARFRRVLRGLLNLALERLGEALANEDEDVAQALLAALQENLRLVLTAALSYAQGQAAEEILKELALLLPEPFGRIVATPQRRPAEVVWRENPPLLSFQRTERVERLLSRFIDDLFREARRRFWLAELLEESTEVAAASLSEDTILARSLSRRFRARLSTLLASEWTLAANQARFSLLSQAAQGAPELKAKFLYFDTGPCDGSCVAWASGGLRGDGVYALNEAPMPVEDTHPNCACRLAPWTPGIQLASLTFTYESEAEKARTLGKDPVSVWLEAAGEGLVEGLNPLEMLRGLEAAIDYVRKSKNKWQAIKELAKGAMVETGRGLKEAVTFGDPRKHGRAIGSLLPDLAITILTGGGGVVKAGTKPLSRLGEVAKAAKKAEEIVKKAKKARPGAAGRALPRGGVAGHGLARAGERRLAEWLEKSGRKFILDPRKRAITAAGPDAITYYWKGNRCIVEFWDNKAWTQSRAVSSSSALERLGNDREIAKNLRKWLDKSGLPREEIKGIKEAISQDKALFIRKVSNAGGKARPGPSLVKKGILFEEMAE